MTKRLSPDYPRLQATKLLKEILKKSLTKAEYTISFTKPHFYNELKNDGLDINDAYFILEKGTIFDEPEFYNNREWRYRVEGSPIDSKIKTILVITFTSKTKITVITIFKKKKGNK